MTKHPIYNDLTIEIPIKIDGQEQSLEGLDIQVYLRCKRVHKKMEIQTHENLVYFTFYGKDQRTHGVYDIEIIINEGKENQSFTRFKEAFELVK